MTKIWTFLGFQSLKEKLKIGPGSFKGTQSCYFFFLIKFHVSFEESSLQRCKFEISVKTVKPFIWSKQFCVLQLRIFYYVKLTLCNYGYHNQARFHLYLPNGTLSKFDMDYEKNMNFLVIPKSPKVWKKLKSSN